MNKHLSIITSNVNGLNAPIKRYRVAEWIRKQAYMLPTRDPPEDRKPTRTESEGLETNFPSRMDRKKKQG